MATICFDVGGTLIDDPFPDTVRAVAAEIAGGELPFPFPLHFLEEFTHLWMEENWNYDFPFASHFLQEEVWLARAALKLDDSRQLNRRAQFPTILPLILGRYRALAKEKIAQQPQLEVMQAALRALLDDGHQLGVASNDRDFATRAMLAWARLDAEFNFAFTSEALSQRYPGAEKPALEFFRAIQSELRSSNKWRPPFIYVGDSETKDIIPALKEGWMPIRFFNALNMTGAAWIATSHSTVAPVSFDHFADILATIRRAVTQMEAAPDPAGMDSFSRA
jgi:FMN phosphatase YigB (HAD superfamily)